MQVGRVYKLILLVLVLVVVSVVVMWGRGGDDATEPEPTDGFDVAEMSDDTDLSSLFEEDGDDVSNVLPDEVPPEVSRENPYFEEDTAVEDPLEGFEEVEGFGEDDTEEVATDLPETEDLDEDIPEADTRYKVQPGDSLEKISRKFYGTITEWKRIADANGITNPRSLKIGQELLIPQGESGNDKEAVAEADNSAGSSKNTYTVQPGDTLGAISLKFFKTTRYWKKIAEANGIANEKSLKVGQKIVIPDVGKETASNESTKPTKAESAEETAKKKSPGTDAREYVVKKNDSLWDISKKFYGTGTMWKVIFEANKERLNGKTDVSVGQKLIIPKAGDEKVAQAKPKKAARKPVATALPEDALDEVEEVQNFLE